MKKSQIFLFDLILSLVIIIVCIGLLFNYYMNVTDNKDISSLNQKILNGFTMTKVNSLNDKEIRNLFVKGKIRNIENTVAQQVGEFHNYSQDELAKNLTRFYVKDYLDKQMNFNITIEKKDNPATVFVLYNVTNQKNSYIDNSSIVSVSERVVFGFNNTDFYGPYVFRVKIWK